MPEIIASLPFKLPICFLSPLILGHERRAPRSPDPGLGNETLGLGAVLPDIEVRDSWVQKFRPMHYALEDSEMLTNTNYFGNESFSIWFPKVSGDDT